MDLLSALTDDYVSGSALAERLDVTRAAISKAAHALAEDGYPIEIERAHGYRLRPGSPSSAALAAALTGRYGREYRYVGQAGSTQDELRSWALADAPDGAVVLAERQDAGRGRRGRSWTTLPGSGLAFSVLLRPQLPVARLPLLSLAAGVAVVDAIGAGSLKWPNDVLAPDGRKMAGVLAESQTSGEEIDFVLLGIGIDVDAPAPEGGAAVAELDPSVRRVEVLARVLAALEPLINGLADPAPILAAWTQRTQMLGKTVRAQVASGSIIGVAESLDPSGALVLRLEDGSTTSISAGDVELVREAHRPISEARQGAKR